MLDILQRLATNAASGLDSQSRALPLLEQRDDDDFDASWVKANDALQAALREASITDEAQAQIERIAEAAFMAVVRANVDGASELAGYVSDDFRLFATAVAVDFDSPWVAALLGRYLERTLSFDSLTAGEQSIRRVLQPDAADE